MSDIAKFTPGPWAYRPELHDDWGVVRAGRFWICQAKDPNVCSDEQLAQHRAAKTDPWEANAHLIAAAPELYEVLALCVAELEATDPFSKELVSKATAALSKARGEA